MIESKQTLKTYFQTGDVPTEQQFANLIDSFLHTQDNFTFINVNRKYPAASYTLATALLKLQEEEVIRRRCNNV